MYLTIEKEFLEDHVLYSLSDSLAVFHIGIVPFKQLTSLSDVPDMPDGEITLMIVDTDKDKFKLANRAREEFPAFAAQIMALVNEWKRRRVGKEVRCIDTGEIFPTLTAAARAHDLTYSSLCNHVKGMKGFRSVRGKVYEYVR